jgi:PAS domain S-box-containing protein
MVSTGEELQRCEDWIRLLTENALDVTFRYELAPRRRFACISPAVTAITGHVPEDFLADPDLLFTLAGPGDRELLVRGLSGETAGGEAFTVRLVRNDGLKVWAEVYCTPIRDEAGKGMAVEGIIRDATQRITIEQDLRAQSRMLRERMKELNCLIGISEYIETEPSVPVLCQRIVDLIPTAYRFPEIACARLTIDGGEYRTANFGESPIVQTCQVSVYGVATGTVEVRYLIEHEEMGEGAFLAEKQVLLDTIAARVGKLFERHRTEEALHEVISKLNLLNSITRHDILNQITVLRAYQELLMERASDPLVREYLHHQEKATMAIRRLITFTRDYQDIGVLSPDWQEVAATLRRTLTVASMPPFTVEIQVGEYEVYADPLLEKVFFNLLENARAHGGEVTRVRFSSEEADEGLILVCEDDGDGIPVAEKDLIFEQGYGRKTGYGLFLAREILSITGLAIRETGTYGKGARFEILAPPGSFRPASGTRSGQTT